MGLLDGILGSSFEDPRTMATLQLAQGLLGGGGSMQRLAGGLQGYGGVMAQARQAEEEKKRRALQEQMLMQQLEAAKAQQAERAAAQQAEKDFRSRITSPELAAAQSTLAGGGGPSLANAARTPSVDPMARMAFDALQTGQMSPMQYMQMQQKDNSPFNLGPGGRLVARDGRVIAEAPFKPEAQPLPQIGALQAYRDGLPPLDPRRREVQALIDNQTRPPKYAGGGGPAPDPTMGADPTQMALNQRFGKPPANRRWKSDGSLEVIPGSADDRKATEQTAGKETVDSVVASLRSSYDGLNKGGGITSTARGALENIPAAISRSAVGQVAGGIVGSQNQKERDAIAQARPLLLQAIMKATGMSAKQMDSNAELKLYLATATDPTLSLEANREALDRIEKLYGSGATGAKQRTVVRTGTLNGRKVVQYSDGSTDYAD